MTGSLDELRTARERRNLAIFVLVAALLATLAGLASAWLSGNVAGAEPVCVEPEPFECPSCECHCTQEFITPNPNPY